MEQTSTSVSYTHLDVYKRQLQPGIRSRIKGRTPGAYFDTLIREEGLALTRQSLLLETAQGADADLLRCITEEEAVHLRLLHTLAGRF